MMKNKDSNSFKAKKGLKLYAANIFLKTKKYLIAQSKITFTIAGIIILLLLTTATAYLINSNNKISVYKNTTSVKIPPTKTPTPIVVNPPAKTLRNDAGNVTSASETAAPTSTALTIRMHLLDAKTGNPISNAGNKITINGEGISETVENQGEASFTLSSPGTYDVIANNLSGYSEYSSNCSIDKCQAIFDSCGRRVTITQGNVDIWCKYENLNQGSTKSQNNTHSVTLNSIDPSSGTVGSSIVLRGSGFGASNGYVMFYSSSGQNSGGGPIDSWNDSEIKARVPAVAGNSSYQIEIESSDGSKSNKISFTVGATQPYINGIETGTTQSAKTITIKGSGFGNNQGTVNIYSNYPTLAQGYTISSWSDTEVNVNVSGISNSYQEYAVGVTISSGPSSSLKYVSW